MYILHILCYGVFFVSNIILVCYLDLKACTELDGGSAHLFGVNTRRPIHCAEVNLNASDQLCPLGAFTVMGR